MANIKRVLYVGNLADEVDIKTLKAHFSTFGDIIDINLPLESSGRKHKGFAFIEYQLPEDAADALDNMDNGEILGKTIRVSIAQQPRVKHNTNRPIWSSEDYLLDRQKETDDEKSFA